MKIDYEEKGSEKEILRSFGIAFEKALCRRG
jgi:hypothetical protein